MNYTILVVDDSWESREVITSILSSEEEYNLVAAENGKEAMTKLQSDRFDLVITDISMPVMDGLELLDHLANQMPSLPVITYTGFGDLFGVKALERGAEDCVFKPFEARDFKLRVSKALKYSRIRKYQNLLEQKNEELRLLSVTDQLTQLYNRHFMQDMLKREFARAKRYQSKLSCVFVDVDNFRRINEEYGHLQGDSVLREFAGFLKNNTREVDIRCRLSADDFVIILPETDRAGAECMADRLRQAAETMPIFRVDSAELLTELKISISVGISTFPDPRIHTEMDLVSLSSEAIQKAKEQGSSYIMTA